MNNIFKFFLTLALIASVGIVASAQTAPKKKVAVYMTGKDINESYKKVIGAKLVSTITATDEYAAVERTADFLAALSAENDYQTSGEVRDSQIAALGQKFGVRYVVVADVSEVFEELFVTARLINVESALVEKAFDANAHAESMAQLIDISTKVAKGLLGESGFSQSGEGISTEPTNMSLCATKDGNTVYIKPSQWEQMKESEKITFNKKGILLMENGEAFIVGMRDVYGDVYKARRLNAPTLFQLKMIYHNIGSLNAAMRIFGGVPLHITERSSGIGYISSDYSKGESYGYKMYLNSGDYNEDKWIEHPVNLIRSVQKFN